MPRKTLKLKRRIYPSLVQLRPFIHKGLRDHPVKGPLVNADLLPARAVDLPVFFEYSEHTLNPFLVATQHLSLPDLRIFPQFAPASGTTDQQHFSPLPGLRIAQDIFRYNFFYPCHSTKHCQALCLFPYARQNNQSSWGTKKISPNNTPESQHIH